mgnify:CR=1 FL=1
MDNLVFSLNATVPIFLMMILGLFFNKIGWMDEEFANKMNKFVFRIPLPVLLFGDLAVVDIKEAWDTKFVIFCFIITLISITIAIGISCLLKDRSIQGEFIQGAYRSSAALLGIAFIQNIYGNSGQAPLMIIGSVPLYNVMAVIVLSFFHPERKAIDKAVWMKTLKGIVTNPIIIGIVAGLIWSACKIPMPVILNKTVTSIGGMSTPMGLMAMGATFDFRKALGKIKPAVTATIMKLIVFVAIFLPIAVKLGFRQEELIAILVMLGSATTVSSFVMAKNMGHEGVLSSSVVMLTTLFSAFTLTGWLYVLKAFQLV